MTLEERVIKTIEDNLEKKEKVTLHMNLRNDLGLDSFAMVILINALEDEFGITIEERNFNGINSVFDIVNGLKQHYPDIKESNGKK
ncbi:MAG: acyl carrier protein [Nanoarchaeota archaeon]|nr:acyl carrier protein [Nanoarchaeota archaeon]